MDETNVNTVQDDTLAIVKEEYEKRIAELKEEHNKEIERINKKHNEQVRLIMTTGKYQEPEQEQQPSLEEEMFNSLKKKYKF